MVDVVAQDLIDEVLVGWYFWLFRIFNLEVVLREEMASGKEHEGEPRRTQV